MSGHHRNFTNEFKQEAIRLALSSGQPRHVIASDIGVARSTLCRWIQEHQAADLLSGPHDDVDKELARLRRENALLRQERDLLKKATAFFARETSK